MYSDPNQADRHSDVPQAHTDSAMMTSSFPSRTHQDSQMSYACVTIRRRPLSARVRARRALCALPCRPSSRKGVPSAPSALWVAPSRRRALQGPLAGWATSRARTSARAAPSASAAPAAPRRRPSVPLVCHVDIADHELTAVHINMVLAVDVSSFACTGGFIGIRRKHYGP